MTFFYALNGVFIDSDLPLGTLNPVDPKALAKLGSADEDTLRLRWRSVGNEDLARPQTSRDVLCLQVPASPTDARVFLRVYRGGGRYLLCFPQGTHFVVSETGDAIFCHDLACRSEQALEQLFVDQVLPKVLQLKGRLCLHASAVELRPGHATAVVGCSGDGKSTLCAALTRTGAALLSDDALALHFGETAVEAFRGYGSLRLLPDSAAKLSTEVLPLVSERTTKRRLSRALAPGSSRLGRVVLLSPGSALSLERLRRAEAASLLPKFLHRLDPTRQDLLAQEFKLMMALAAKVPLYRLNFQHRFDAIDKVACLLQQE